MPERSYPFREPTEIVKEKTKEAKEMVDMWKKSYLDVRAKIEASGRDERWEFDRKRLFDKTDYAGVICQDIHKVVQVRGCYLNSIIRGNIK